MNIPIDPTGTEPPATAADDPRCGNFVRRVAWPTIPADTRVAIVGFPSDDGVRLNGGRPGAASAPESIRRWLYRLTPDARQYDRHAALLRQTVDLGNVRCDHDLPTSQQVLGELVRGLLDRHLVPIILGGGHETSYGHFLGYALSDQPAAILNVDAHPDVRPLVESRPHSGSPFRQALEHASGSCRQYTVMGLSPHAVSATHVEFVRRHGGRCVWKEQVDLDGIERTVRQAGSPLMVTLDMDAVDQRDAPGVSAPNADGLPAAVWLQAAFLFGTCPQVRSLDLVEVNPRFDVDDRTCRLAALTIWQFTQGLACRLG